MKHHVETQGQVRKRHRVRRQPFSSFWPWFPQLLLSAAKLAAAAEFAGAGAVELAAAAVELAAAAELDAAAAGAFEWLLLFHQLLLRESAAVAGCSC